MEDTIDPVRTIFAQGFCNDRRCHCRRESAAESLDGTPAAGPSCQHNSEGRQAHQPRARCVEGLPFPLTQVRLGNGPCKIAMEADRQYLQSLPPDRLLHTFRINAGLASSAQPLGGWEAPDCELRGHYAGGHYLSACALMYASTGDEDLKKNAALVVSELAKCQAALKSGYLSAFPIEFFDRLRERQRSVGAFLHHPQNHGRPARHVRLLRQRAGARHGRERWRTGSAAIPARSATSTCSAYSAPSLAAWAKCYPICTPSRQGVLPEKCAALRQESVLRSARRAPR